MRIIVACECSGTVRDAFIARGHDAISCDLKPTETPGPHHVGDVIEFLSKQTCDLLIAHPPCTYIARVSAPWLARDESRVHKMRIAVDFFHSLWTFKNAEYICVENPYPLAQAQLPRWTQVIQPYQFGHAYTKATCLWLRGLPPLQTTDPQLNPHSWIMQFNGKERATNRARTFPGIATAMAEQWGNLKQRYGFFL